MDGHLGESTAYTGAAKLFERDARAWTRRFSPVLSAFPFPTIRGTATTTGSISLAYTQGVSRQPPTISLERRRNRRHIMEVQLVLHSFFPSWPAKVPRQQQRWVVLIRLTLGVPVPMRICPAQLPA
jgi:hypothetical protein